MRFLKQLAVSLVVLVVGGAAWVRFAPGAGETLGRSAFRIRLSMRCRERRAETEPAGSATAGAEKVGVAASRMRRSLS